MIIKIAWKNILHQPLSSLLSWLLLSVSVGIISLLLIMQQQLENQFTESSKDIDMVIGAKGSPLQLILSSVYHVDAPTGNIKLGETEKWMQHPFIEKAIPLAYGDSYKGFSIIGTTAAYLDKYDATVASGHLYEKNFEVVIGASLAQKLLLQCGSSFYGTHGDKEGGAQHKEHPYVVTGILQPTGTVLDNLIISNIESVWQIHEHHEAQNTVHKEEEKELTAVLIKFRNPVASIQLPRLINENTNMMAAMPAIEINRLFSLLGIGFTTLQKIGTGIMVLAALSVFIALFNSLKERKYELALMRTAGAGRLQLFSLLLSEGLLLGVAGFITGMLFSRMALWLIGNTMEKDYPFTLQPFKIQWPQEGGLLVVSMLIVTVAALLPAVKAGSLNISKTLSNG